MNFKQTIKKVNRLIAERDKLEKVLERLKQSYKNMEKDVIESVKLGLWVCVENEISSMKKLSRKVKSVEKKFRAVRFDCCMEHNQIAHNYNFSLEGNTQIVKDTKGKIVAKYEIVKD